MSNITDHEVKVDITNSIVDWLYGMRSMSTLFNKCQIHINALKLLEIFATAFYF